MKCPHCGHECEADFVDIGVGEQRVGLYHCAVCLWVEEDPEADDPDTGLDFTFDENGAPF